MRDPILPDDVVMAVGRIVLNFQYLERKIVELIWIMAGPDENVGQRITARVQFARLCDLLSSLFYYQVQEPSFVEKFERLLSDIRRVNESRNRIVHSWWFMDHIGEPSRLKIRAKSGEADSENLDLNTISVSILDVSDGFMRFVDELYEAKLISRKPGVWLSSLLQHIDPTKSSKGS